MDRKITLALLAESVTRRIPLTGEEAEKWIKDYFAVIADAMASGESVKVKGLGTFKLSGIEARESVDVSTGKRMLIPGHQRATFTPEKSFAEAVNAPFAAFEAVELSPDLTEEELSVAVEEIDAAAEPEAAEEAAPQTAVKEVSDKTEKQAPVAKETVEDRTPVSADVPVHEDIEADNIKKKDVEAKKEPDTEPMVIVEEEESQAIAEEAGDGEYDDDVEEMALPRRRHSASGRGFLPGFLIGVACMLALLAGLWCWYRFAPESFDSILGRPAPQQEIPVVAASVEKKAVPAKPVATTGTREEVTTEVKEVVTETEVADEVPTRPSDEADKNGARKEPVYDTISKSRFLTTMAREYYGSYTLWPYIYEENKAILGHPDRIKPGTRIVIPPAEKYGIDRHDKACMAKARKMAAEIYGRYK